MKLGYDEVLERLNEERPVHEKDVKSRALQRKVWVAAWGKPGCLYEAQSACRTKEEAVEAALFYAEGEYGVPRGMKTTLELVGIFYSGSPIFGDIVTVVYSTDLGSLLL
jgi:hypothetical protein